MYGNTTVFHFASTPGAGEKVALTIDDGLCRHSGDRAMIREVRQLLKALMCRVSLDFSQF